MREETSKQELKIKEVDTRIEQEIAALRTSIQVSKVRVLSPPAASTAKARFFGSDGRSKCAGLCTQATTLQYLVGFGASRCSCDILCCSNRGYTVP